MWEESREKVSPLRTGLTTGACATACTVACAQALLDQQKPTVVSIILPKGKAVDLPIVDIYCSGKRATSCTIKDAGDDPDITHGATVFVELTLCDKPGVVFKAAEGVGTVTKEGLSLAVGEPAINPVPRKMMIEHLGKIATYHNYTGGFEVAVGVKNGASLAIKTMNPKLGIIGGLSILGTTGIVRPFSCGAWIASIYQGIDVAIANGVTHLAACTGNSSEQAIRKHYHLSEIALIEMGDFAGALLKHIKKNPVKKLSICGGIGKISKLANGHKDLHSKSSSINFCHMATLAKTLGASATLINSIKKANTSIEVVKLCDQNKIDIANALCQAALEQVRQEIPLPAIVEIWAINRHGQFIGNAGVTH